MDSEDDSLSINAKLESQGTSSKGTGKGQFRIRKLSHNKDERTYIGYKANTTKVKPEIALKKRLIWSSLY